jgi:N-acetylneuraminic acid mutarotase
MQKISTALIVIAVLACLVISNSNYASAAENEWVSKADTPTARAYLGVATVAGKIYAISATNGGLNEEYDPQNDTWTTKTSMVISGTSFAIAVYGDKIYCVGGQDDNLRNRAVTQVYDPATDTWEIKTSMPTARYGATAQVVDGKIYVIGGAKGIGYNKGIEASNVTEVYNPSTDTWTTKTAMPYATASVSSVIENKIYLFGSQITQIYDPTTDTWTIGTSPQEAINMGGYGLAATATTTGEMAPKRIYIYDGTNMQVYNPYTDSWTFANSPPTSRQFAGMAVVDDLIYVIGGVSYPLGVESYFVFLKTNEQYTPVGYGSLTPSPSESSAVSGYSLVVPVVLLVIAVVVVVVAVYLVRYRR